MTTTPRFTGHYPGRAPIDAYGNGGFRFADMSHRGALLCLPDGMHASTSATPDVLALEALARLQSQPFETQTVLLVGTGARQVFLSAVVRAAFTEAAIGLEMMDTGAACRTFNILLAERRPVGAALLPVG